MGAEGTGRYNKLVQTRFEEYIPGVLKSIAEERDITVSEAHRLIVNLGINYYYNIKQGDE